MYKLYSLPGSCSLGIHVLLNALNQKVEIINVKEIDNFKEIIPIETVPVLEDSNFLIREGAAIVLYLLEKHNSKLLPIDLKSRSIFLQKLFFNYATMHPAYGKLFFAMKNLTGEGQKQAYKTGARAVSDLWKIVDKQLSKTSFVGGDIPSILDYLLCVYANWGAFFDVDIDLGDNVTRMIREVIQLQEFQKALKIEGIEYKTG